MKETALIIVDVQNDFLPPLGALAVPGGKEIVPLLKGLLGDEWDWTAVIATQVSCSKPGTLCTPWHSVTIKSRIIPVEITITSGTDLSRLRDGLMNAGLSPQKSHFIRLDPHV